MFHTSCNHQGEVVVLVIMLCIIQVPGWVDWRPDVGGTVTGPWNVLEGRVD